MSAESVITVLLHDYGLERAKTRLLQKLWNETYYIEAENGSRYNLRLCSPTYRDKSSLADELFWLEYIAMHTAVSAPRPLANRQGETITVVAAPEGDRFSC